jgi:hypothetical protein
MGYYAHSPLQVVETGVKTPGFLKGTYTTDFWWNPPFGRPRNIDYPELEEYEHNVYVQMVINHIIDSVVKTDWAIVGIEEGEEPPEDIVKEVTDFFLSKKWQESWKSGLRRMLPDLLLYDCGVLIKVFPKKDYDEEGILETPKNKGSKDYGKMQADDDEDVGLDKNQPKPVEMMARDGRSFLKDQTLYGTIKQFFQYTWMGIQGKPIAFDVDEIVYLQMRLASRSPYGVSNLEVIKSVVDYLTSSINANRKYWENGFFPGGHLDHPDMVDIDELTKRAQLYKEQLKGEENYNKWLITSGGVKVTPLQFTNQQMSWLQSSEYFARIVFAIFKVPASELGFTEGQNRATGIQQSTIYKAKGVQNVLDLLEDYINRDIIWKHFSEEVKFVFDDSLDLQDEKIRADIDHVRVEDGITTINEIRKRDGLDLFEDDFFDAPFAAQVAAQEIMMSGMGGEEGEMGGEPGVQSGEERTPEEGSAEPTGGSTETREEAEKMEKATNVSSESGAAGYALTPIVVDSKKRKKQKKDEKDLEESTVKNVKDWSKDAHDVIESRLEQLYGD